MFGIKEKALQIAALAHDGQYRKGAARLPYLTHVVMVAYLVEQYGGSDEIIAAALLHDTVEDTLYRAETLQLDFGERVATIVATLTEAADLPRKERKAAYVTSLKAGSIDAVLISACDLDHNLNSVIDEFESAQPPFREHFFNPDRLTEYRPRVAVITERLGVDHPAVTALQKTFTTYTNLVNS